ncbi:MAG: hypothetical protein JWO10_1326 [Microbacteriaceae bacterium]|nr:hypothetical protein [Microbacteriaceae bacterium]
MAPATLSGVTSSSPDANPFQYLQRNAEQNPNGVFVRSVDQVITNGEALVRVKKIALEMRRLGVKPGHIVALELPDMLAMLFTFAILHEAAISTVLPDGYVADGIFQVDWIFSRKTPSPQRGATVVPVDQKFLQHVEENPYGISQREEPVGVVRILFSSGTTGAPNAIPSHASSLALYQDAFDTWLEGDPFLVLMDFGTPWGFSVFYFSVIAGRPYLSVGRAKPDAIIKMIIQNSVTSLKGSPAQIASVVDEAERQGITVPSVESVHVGGTVMPPGVADRMRAAAEGCTIYSMYGSTEAKITSIKVYDRDDPYNAGRPLPTATIEIVDENDEVVPIGTPGRVRQKSPSMSHEYLGNPSATRQAFRNGWFYPGDLGLLRPDSGLTLTGRESETLNAGGVKIDPNRLDHFAMRNPKVKDACAFEYQVASGMTQIGMALVTDEDIDIQQVITELKAEFFGASPKLVARVDEIPRGRSGKPLRRILAERYSEI